MKVLVYGFYHHANLGDNLFMEAFRHLFPDYDFVFADSINLPQLTDIDAVFLGGGSFLLDKPQITDQAFEELKHRRIFYLGVGVETDIHPMHIELMSRAQMIATRSPEQLERLKSLNGNSFYLPDLVYCLQNKVKINPKTSRSVLIFPNISVVPQRIEPHWKHAAWNYFKSEFTQFMDWLIDNEYNINLFSMCHGIEMDDDWVSGELISHMENRNRYYIHSIYNYPSCIKEISDVVNKYGVIITQRFHGIVLAEMTRTPYVALHHHDKLKNSLPRDGIFLSYYNCSKQLLIDSFNQAVSMNFTNPLPINSSIFDEFSQEVAKLLS